MIPQFDHYLYSSYFLWFQQMLLNQGQAYVNRTGGFQLSSDPQVNGLSCYPTNWKQLLYDSSISGGNIFSGVYVSGTNTFLSNTGGQIAIDYLNGRVLATGNYPNGFTGSFSTLEYNLYTPGNNTVEFILESLYQGNPDLGLPATGVAPSPYAAPCVILSLDFSKNEGFSFGGFDSTNAIARAYVISSNRWGSQGIMSIFRDTNMEYIPIITGLSDIPLDYYNNLKTGYFNYNNVISKYNQPNNWAWIKSVKVSQLSEQKNKNWTFFLSYLEFELDTIRLPRQPGPQF